MVRRERQIFWFGLVGAIVSLAIVGCGTGDSGTNAAAATGPLTKGQFVKAAEQICERRIGEKEKALQTAYEEFEEGSHTEQQIVQKRKEIAEGMLSKYKEIASELGELQPPAQDKATVEDILAKMQDGIAKGEADALSLVETNLFAKADNAAKNYGFVMCGSL